MSTSKSIGKGIKSAISSSVIQAGAQLVTLVVTSRLLSAAELGLAALLLLAIGMCRHCATVLVGHPIIKSQDFDEHDQTFAIILCFLGGTAICALALTLPLLLHSPPLNTSFAFYGLAGLIFLLEILIIPLESFSARSLDFGKIATANSLAAIFGTCGITIGFSLLGFGVYSFFIGAIGQTLTRLFILRQYINWHGQPAKISLERFRHTYSFGVKNLIVESVSYLTVTLDQLLVGKFFNISALGIYSRASQLANYPINFFGIASDRVLFASLSRTNNIKEISQIYKNYFSLTFTLALFVSITISLLAKDIIEILLGKNWLDSIILLKVLSIIIFSRLSYKANDAALRALGRLRLRFVLQVSFLLLTFAIASAFAFLTKQGTLGVAYGATTASLIYLAVSSYAVGKLLDINHLKLIKDLGRPILTALTFTAINHIIRNQVNSELPGTGGNTLIYIITIVVFIALIVTKPSTFLGNNLIKSATHFFGNKQNAI